MNPIEPRRQICDSMAISRSPWKWHFDAVVGCLVRSQKHHAVLQLHRPQIPASMAETKAGAVGHARHEHRHGVRRRTHHIQCLGNNKEESLKRDTESNRNCNRQISGAYPL